MHPDLLENSKTIYLGHIDEMHHVSSSTALCTPNSFQTDCETPSNSINNNACTLSSKKKYQKILN